MVRQKIIQTIGKRKKAIARAVAKSGSGIVRINSKPLDSFSTKYIRMWIKEPLMLAGKLSSKLDIDVTVNGGGVWGQAGAVRTAIGQALVKFDEKLKEKFIEYDRTLLISDYRRTEPHKPSRSSAGSRRTKQQSKR